MSGSEAPLLMRARGLSKAYPLDDRPAQGLVRALSRQLRPTPSIEVLTGVDLEIRRGESLGILGRNGAGKTTLLSILGGVADPTHGSVERFGSVATILGVGERLNEDMTGVQNAELFCDTQGLAGAARAEAIRRIERFAELGDYFHRPLRTYSAGMRGRLGFSCAANVEADLIIVDEVLSVGDADFRQKCLHFIEGQQARGVTYLIVSHSIGLVANLCSRALVLEGGRKLFDGGAREGVAYYKQMLKEGELRRALADPDGQGPVAPIGKDGDEGGSDAALELVRFSHADPEPAGGGRSGFALTFRARKAVRKPDVRVAITDEKGIGVAGFRSKLQGPAVPDLPAGAEVTLKVAYQNRLTRGRYYYRVGLASVSDQGEALLHHSEVAGAFEVDGPQRIGLVDLDMEPVEFSVEPGVEPSGRRSRLGFFLHLPGDVEALGGILEAALAAPDLTATVLVHDGLFARAPRAREVLTSMGAEVLVARSDAAPAEWLAVAGGADAWLFATESTLRPHRAAHDMAAAAQAAGARTFSVQHGFENVGLSFFDDVHGTDVRFAAERVLTWSPAEWFPKELPADTRAKVVPVGRARRRRPAAGDPWPEGAKAPDVAVFENIHWHRFSDAYRARFLEDLQRLCVARPDRTVLVRPHPQGRWLTERFKGARPAADNLVIADPVDERWARVEADHIIDRAGLVLTTPSTVALDAAQADAPVALLAYDLEAPLYRELTSVRTWEQLIALVDDPAAREAARVAGRRFVAATLAPGDAAPQALHAIRSAIHPEAPTP